MLDLTTVNVPSMRNCVSNLNQLPEPPREKRIEISDATNAPMQVRLVPNLADDPLVIGPRYQTEDFRCNYATHLGSQTSGVLLLGLNEGTRLTFKVHTSRPTRAYKITGCLGKSTDTYYYSGKVVERASFGHVTRGHLDKLLALIQAAHQRKMFDACGVHLQSQSAFELAAQGALRPARSDLPLLYGIRCVHFAPPLFTIEVQSINEYEHYLLTLIHELGLQLKTAAHCTAVQCIRQGKFTVEHALLRKHWQLPHIMDNIELCDRILEENKRLLMPLSAALM